MCESIAYLKKGDELTKIMDNVIFVEPKDDKVFIEDILGQQMAVTGKIEEIRLLDHKLVITQQ